MRSVKFLLAAVILLSLSREATAQYVQPMRYDHYSVTQQMNVGAGVVRTTNASAYLEIGPTSGGNKGLLIPRLSTTERDAISTPATGLLIFNTTTGTFNFYTGSAWSAITSGSSTGISQLGNSGNWGLTRVNDSTYRADSMAVMTKYQSEKTRDSLIALIAAKLNITDTSAKWYTSIYRKTASDSVFGIIGGTHTFLYKDSIGAGGGGISGSGTSGQLTLWNGASSVTGTTEFNYTTGSYPRIDIGGAGDVFGGLGLRDAAGTWGYVTGENGLTLFGSSTYDMINFYDYAGGTQMVQFRNTGTVNNFSFYNGRATFNYMTPGASDGTVHIEGAVGDSTSLSSSANTHASRVITKLYANATSVNNFYGTIHSANTNAGASQNHGAIFQSDFKKTGNHKLENIYHFAILADSLISGVVDYRYGVKIWDAVKISATLGVNNPFNIAKLKAGLSNFGIISDSSHFAWLDGNILIGDSVVAASARKTIHIFNGTAPSANISGAILYAESGELKVRDSGGNITTLSDPAGGSGTDNANVGSGYRWVKPSTQEIKTFFDGLYLDIDSSSNTDGLTVKVDTASMFPQIRSTIPASSGAQISGTPSANQMAYWVSATEIAGHNGFTFSPGSYPSFQIGGTGTNEGTLYIKDAVGTTGGITGTNGFYAFGSSTYKQLDFYSHIGGSYLLQMKNNAGVLTADFQSGVAVTIASTLQVNTTIKQAGTASALSGYMLTNSGNLASTTNLNPGVLVYNASNNGYGMDLGYNSSRYATRIFAPTSTGISFGRMATGATAHSNYTESMYLDGSGNLGIGDATPASMLTVGSGDLFQVNSSGNIVKIRNVTYSFPSSQGAANTVWRNDGSGNLSSYVVTAGTQTPTATNGTNVSASTPGQEQYTRVGNVVTVSGYIAITCTSAGASSDIDLSLPVASAFTTTTQLAGVILESVTGVASPGHGTIASNDTNDRVTIIFTPRATGSLSYRYTYTYQIL